jgi:hypothetical protein
MNETKGKFRSGITCFDPARPATNGKRKTQLNQRTSWARRMITGNQIVERKEAQQSTSAD